MVMPIVDAATNFACPSDKKAVLVEMMIFVKGQFFLYGHCSACGEKYRFLVDDVINRLLEGQLPPRNRGAN